MYQNVQNQPENTPKTPGNAVGTTFENEGNMEKRSLRKLMLVTGIVVALLVVVLLNTAFLFHYSADINNSKAGLEEMMRYAIPQVIFALF